jgi:hypothetical protein
VGYEGTCTFAVCPQRLQHDFRAFQTAKQGKAVQLQDGEHMAARLFSIAEMSDKCGCCHLCNSDFQGYRQQQEPPWDEETHTWIPYHMESRMACANIRNPEARCLKKLAMMALAVGKEAAIFSLLGDSSVGRKLEVCQSKMFRVTNRETVQYAVVPARVMHRCKLHVPAGVSLHRGHEGSGYLSM